MRHWMYDYWPEVPDNAFTRAVAMVAAAGALLGVLGLAVAGGLIVLGAVLGAVAALLGIPL